MQKENENAYEWIDLPHPDAHDLISVMEHYDLHKTAILDSLDPHHLPKLERYKSGIFLIVRMYDRNAPDEEDDLQRMTKKVSVYLNGSTLISIRREDDSAIKELIYRWKHKSRVGGLVTPTHPLNEILEAVIESYNEPLEKCQEQVERLEKHSFGSRKDKAFEVEKAYGLIAKTSVIKRILSLTLHIVDRIGFVPEDSRPYYNDLKESIEGLLYWAGDIHESTSRIIQLQISLEAQYTNRASHETNEIMKILTVFSAFLMPLNLMASLYGMNFSNLPLADHPAGFWLSIASMGGCALVIFIWFYLQGWFVHERPWRLPFVQQRSEPPAPPLRLSVSHRNQ